MQHVAWSPMCRVPGGLWRAVLLQPLGSAFWLLAQPGFLSTSPASGEKSGSVAVLGYTLTFCS